MLWFLLGVVLVVLGGYILISLLQIVFAILAYIISFIFSIFE